MATELRDRIPGEQAIITLDFDDGTGEGILASGVSFASWYDPEKYYRFDKNDPDLNKIQLPKKPKV